jgi:ribosomal protein S18 acetylase RimI-like enzyme
MLSSGGWWVINLRESLSPIGIIGINGLRTPQLGFVVMPRYRSKGYCGESLGMLLQHLATLGGFGGRVEALTHPANIATQAILQRFGFTERGSVLEYYPNEGRIIGSKVFGLDQARQEGARSGPESAAVQVVLGVSELRRAIAFYEQIGFALDFVHGSPVQYAGLSLGWWSSSRARVHLIETRQHGATPSLWVYIAVGEAITEVYARCAYQSLVVTQELTEVAPGLSEFAVHDLEGHTLVFRSHL